MVGHVTVQELDWSIPDHYSAVSPPFDFVLAADCVYHEHIVEDFLRTVLAVTHNKSTGRSVFAPVCVYCLYVWLPFTSCWLMPASEGSCLRNSSVFRLVSGLCQRKSVLPSCLISFD